MTAEYPSIRRISDFVLIATNLLGLGRPRVRYVVMASSEVFLRSKENMSELLLNGFNGKKDMSQAQLTGQMCEAYQLKSKRGLVLGN